jgi:predicted RNA-binding Zn-ribbon protein involved in translation (DUF1610 family)
MVRNVFLLLGYHPSCDESLWVDMMAKAIGTCVNCGFEGEFDVSGVRAEVDKHFVKLKCPQCEEETPFLKIRKDTLKELIGELH